MSEPRGAELLKRNMKQNKILPSIIISIGIFLAGVAVSLAIFYTQSFQIEVESNQFVKQQKIDKRNSCFDMFIGLKKEYSNVEFWYYNEGLDACSLTLTEKNDDGSNKTKILW